MHPKEERTVVIVKPDGVKRGLIGEIISRLERRGLKVIALEMFTATKAQIDDHYPKDSSWIKRLGEKTLANYKKYGWDASQELGTDKPEEIGIMVRGWLIDYMTSSPLVKMVVRGIHAVDMVRKISGPTFPYLADMGTIRGDFSNDSPVQANAEKRAIMNVVHASETPEEATHEIKLWFGDATMHKYSRHGE